jgi:hypothetical protein
VRDAAGAPVTHTPYELGLAVGQLTVQAHADGLSVHQMAGLEGDDLHRAFGVPAEYDALIVLAVGAPGDPHRLPETLQQRELAPRERVPLRSIAFRGEWGRPAV